MSENGSGSVVHGTRENFRKVALENDKLVVVDFWAPWCGPCRALAPTLDALAREMPDVSFVKVNVDEEGELAGEHGIVSVPTLKLVFRGREVGRIVGVVPKVALRDELRRAVAELAP